MGDKGLDNSPTIQCEAVAPVRTSHLSVGQEEWNHSGLPMVASSQGAQGGPDGECLGRPTSVGSVQVLFFCHLQLFGCD